MVWPDYRTSRRCGCSSGCRAGAAGDQGPAGPRIQAPRVAGTARLPEAGRAPEGPRAAARRSRGGGQAPAGGPHAPCRSPRDPDSHRALPRRTRSRILAPGRQARAPQLPGPGDP